ncbi:DUF3772 domain-containing protein [Actibacterium lipolyticum]|uniref:DUF3772 domain-containing protein n=1 Tax=Actibacterium lipolyticum TaxID=1524263 RepID=UPI001131AEE0|nr:DUF3772 domain-containing protein [Actibacterium lipolyticum]
MAQSTSTTATEAVQEAPNYTAWQEVAEQTEDAIGSGAATNSALEKAREEIAAWRSRFLDAQSLNQTRIETLGGQIAALGAAPEEGATEPQEIADRRAALNSQLKQLQAPVLSAEEAYRRADGLIREIDTIIRDRQADELLQLGPSPINPTHWSTGITAISGTFSGVAQEVATSWNSEEGRANLREDLPAVLFYLAVALVLILRGRRWMEKNTIRYAESTSLRARGAFIFLISLGQIVLPYIGLVALLKALNSTGLLGERGTQLSALIPTVGLVILSARWLGGRIFPKANVQSRLFNLSRQRTAEARWNAAGLGVVVGMAGLLDRMSSFEDYAPAAQATLGFPILVIGAVLMFRLARLLMNHVQADAADGHEGLYRNRLIVLIARASMVTAVLGPVLAAIGYERAAGFFTYPSIATLALFGLLAVLQRLVADIYAMVTGDSESARDALIPVLIGFMLLLMALPVLALIWGARVADLTEIWTKFTEGFSIGETRISPSDFLTFVMIFVFGYMLTRLLQGALRSSVLPKTKIDTGGQNAIVSGTGYIGIFLAAIIAITSAGIDLSSLAIVAGALSVGIGFGLQNIVSNFVSGIILLIERPVSEGDWIEVGGVMGTVRDISVRSTRVETFDRTDVIVPNSDLISGMVTNWTRSNLTGRIIVPVGVAYGTDTKRVEKILRDIAEAHPLVIINPPPQVLFRGFGADSLDFEIRAILRDVTLGVPTQSEINHEIARRFAEEKIEIPFAQRDIWLRNPEALGGAVPSAE